MILPTTLKSTKDVLLQYYTDTNEYCIIYGKVDDTLNYWLVETTFMFKDKDSTPFYDYCVPAIVYISETIMLQLIDEGFVVKCMSDKEWAVQEALGTAPVHRSYLISGRK